MLNEEVARYRELSGDTTPNVPISRIGGYLDGYEKALEQEPKTDSWSIKDVADTFKKHGLIREQEPCEDWYDVPSDEMTLEQARQAVKDLRKKLAEYLEQEPCPNAISRQAAIDAVIDLCKHYTPTKSVTHPHMDFVIEALQDLPSVNPQPKTGRWIEHPEIETSTPEYLMFYECSECGDKQCFYKSDIHKKRFCINCGCRMIEPQESEVSNG